MKHFINFIFSLILITIILFQGCDDTISQSAINEMVIPDSNVSYSMHIQKVFEAKCNRSGCHNSIDRAGDISLVSWAETTADYFILTPNEPDNSILVWAIERRAGVSQMPPVSYPELTQNHIDGIRIWIDEGAENN